MPAGAAFSWSDEPPPATDVAPARNVRNVRQINDPPFVINTPFFMKKAPACDRGFLTWGGFAPQETNATRTSVLRASNRGLHAHATGTSRVRALPTSNFRDG